MDGTLKPGTYLGARVPGHNVDRVDVGAGMHFAASLGFTSATAQMAIEYALQRWARGEEDAAAKTALEFGQVARTEFFMIVAHARATAEATHAKTAQATAEVVSE